MWVFPNLENYVLWHHRCHCTTQVCLLILEQAIFDLHHQTVLNKIRFGWHYSQETYIVAHIRFHVVHKIHNIVTNSIKRVHAVTVHTLTSAFSFRYRLYRHIVALEIILFFGVLLLPTSSSPLPVLILRIFRSSPICVVIHFQLFIVTSYEFFGMFVRFFLVKELSMGLPEYGLMDAHVAAFELNYMTLG